MGEKKKEVDGHSSACLREDGKIHASVFKLVVPPGGVTKDSPSLWSYVDVLLIDPEEFKAVSNYLEDKFGAGIYYLFPGRYDKIHITLNAALSESQAEDGDQKSAKQPEN